MANQGHDPTRLDRLEGLVEVLFNRHLEFEEQHQRLLTAQVVLTDRIDRLTQGVDEIRELHKGLAQRVNILVSMVDEMIRNRPPQNP